MRSDRKRVLSGLPLPPALRNKSDSPIQFSEILLSNATSISRMSTVSDASAMTDTESLCDTLSRTSLSTLSSRSSEEECHLDASQILLELGKVDEIEWRFLDLGIEVQTLSLQDLQYRLQAYYLIQIKAETVHRPTLSCRFSVLHSISWQLTGTSYAYTGNNNFPSEE